MKNDSKLDQLLDEWEELRESTPRLSLDAYIKNRLGGEPTELVEAFRHQANELASIDRQMERVADPLPTVDQSSNWDNCDLRLSALEPGLEPIAGYKLVTRIGDGGFGEVWKAESPGGFHVALKFVPIGGRGGEIEERSLEVIKDVRHPNLLSVFGTWRIGDLLIIATELADRTLLDRLHEAQKEGHEGIPREELLVYFNEAAKGIDFLNDPGKSGRMRIQHRDIKPQNLLLSGGSVKVGDFGLARSLQYDVTGHTGSLTFAYAAPECFDGTTSNRSDQYSLAITYCHLRGGRLPYEGTQVEIMEGHRKKQPDLSMVPVDERPALAKALAKRPKDRWNSCSEFVQTLSGYDSQPNEVSTLVDTLQQQIAEAPKKWVVGGTGIAVVLLVCLSLLLFSGGGQNRVGQAQVEPKGASTRDTGNADTAPGDADTAPSPITLAVMDFDNHSQDPNLDGFRLGFRDMLVTDLSHLSTINVLERGRLKDLLEEHELAKSPFIAPKTAVRLGKGLSAQHVLTGSYVISDDDIRVDVRLVSVETGEVMLADAVIGNKSNIFPLQQALSSKVLAGLNITPTDVEQAALNEPQTDHFDAFRLYSEARLAQVQGDRAEAALRLQAALNEDPAFELASRELNWLKTEALFRLTESQKERAKAAGEIGTRLREHWNKHQDIVAENRRDAAYFASMIIMSAHAGLNGDTDRERQLLLTFWRHFSGSVPADRFVQVANETRDIVAREGEFFQKTVDSGYYGLLVPPSMTADTHFLKAELRDYYHWPKWSAIWPFGNDVRSAFHHVEQVEEGVYSIDLEPDWFDKQLPSYPHEYIMRILYDDSDDRTPIEDKVGLLGSLILYYSALPEKPREITSSLNGFRRRFLHEIAALEQDELGSEFIEKPIPALKLIAETSVDVEQNNLANKLLIRLVQQVRINKGISDEPAFPDANPVDFYGKSLEGSPILVVWQVGRLGGPNFPRNRIQDHVRESLRDIVRAIPADSRFNFLWTGYVDEDEPLSLFEKPRPADAAAKQKGLVWLSQRAPGSIRETQPLGKVVETIARNWDDRGLVIVVVTNEYASVPQSTIDFVLQRSAPPRFLIVATEEHKQLAQLAAGSNGEAILLKAGGSFLDRDNVTIEPWDISGEKP